MIPLIFGPIATLVVGFTIASIVWQQWLVARNKLRLDLFDRRYKVYDATRNFLRVIFRSATFENTHLFEFYADTGDAHFLFGHEVVEYLKQIRSRALNMQVLQSDYRQLPVSDARTKLVEAENVELKWLTKQITEATTVFAPYLGFSHVK